MITPDRRRERSPYLKATCEDPLSRRHYLFPTLRQGLYQYLQRTNAKRVLLPDYAPEGLFAPVRDSGCSVRFYSVDESFRVDEDELRRIESEFLPDVVIMIHYFGLRLDSHLRVLRRFFGERPVYVEDCAHTLWQAEHSGQADIRTYSLFKLLGVAQGSMLCGGERKPIPEPVYATPTPRDRELCKRLSRRLLIEHVLSTFVRGRRSQSLLLRATAGYADYYSYLCRHYRDLQAPLPARDIELLSRIDMARVAQRRCELARRYVDGLDRKLMFALPRECFLAQPLFAFPVRSAAREELRRYLVRHGVRGTALTERWWFVPGQESSALWRNHFLLPIGHYLSDREVDRVIEVVNSYAAG
jgi:dTDP-4-amino-4,6-dideoxygalactose transaminase